MARYIISLFICSILAVSAMAQTAAPISSRRTNTDTVDARTKTFVKFLKRADMDSLSTRYIEFGPDSNAIGYIIGDRTESYSYSASGMSGFLDSPVGDPASSFSIADGSYDYYFHVYPYEIVYGDTIFYDSYIEIAVIDADDGEYTDGISITGYWDNFYGDDGAYVFLKTDDIKFPCDYNKFQIFTSHTFYLIDTISWVDGDTSYLPYPKSATYLFRDTIARISNDSVNFYPNTYYPNQVSTDRTNIFTVPQTFTDAITASNTGNSIAGYGKLSASNTWTGLNSFTSGLSANRTAYNSTAYNWSTNYDTSNVFNRGLYYVTRRNSGGSSGANGWYRMNDWMVELGGTGIATRLEGFLLTTRLNRSHTLDEALGFASLVRSDYPTITDGRSFIAAPWMAAAGSAMTSYMAYSIRNDYGTSGSIANFYGLHLPASSLSNVTGNKYIVYNGEQSARIYTAGDITADDTVSVGTLITSTKIDSTYQNLDQIYDGMVSRGLGAGGSFSGTLIDTQLRLISTSDNDTTWYDNESITYSFGGTRFAYSFPGKSGTFAMTDDIPDTVTAIASKVWVDNEFVRIGEESGGFDGTLTDTQLRIISTADDDTTWFDNEAITYSFAGTRYIYSFPGKSGTIAMLSDVPDTTSLSNRINALPDSSYNTISVDSIKTLLAAYINMLSAVDFKDSVFMNGLLLFDKSGVPYFICDTNVTQAKVISVSGGYGILIPTTHGTVVVSVDTSSILSVARWNNESSKIGHTHSISSVQYLQDSLSGLWTAIWSIEGGGIGGDTVNTFYTQFIKTYGSSSKIRIDTTLDVLGPYMIDGDTVISRSFEWLGAPIPVRKLVIEEIQDSLLSRAYNGDTVASKSWVWSILSLISGGGWTPNDTLQMVDGEDDTGYLIAPSHAEGTTWNLPSTSGTLALTSQIGEVNTASNITGSGVGIYKEKSTYDLRFKRLKAGSNITITDDTDSVTIASTGGSGGFSGVKVSGGTLISDSVIVRAGNFMTITESGDDTLNIGLDTTSVTLLKVNPSANKIAVWKPTDSLGNGGTGTIDSLVTTTGATIGGNLTVTGTVTATAIKVPMLSIPILTGYTWTNMPAAETELGGNAGSRNIIYLANYDSVRVLAGMGVAGAATNTLLHVEYSTDGTTYYDLGSSADTPTVTVANSVGLKIGSWINIVSGAKSNWIYVRTYGMNGNGSADPQYRHITLNFK